MNGKRNTRVSNESNYNGNGQQRNNSNGFGRGGLNGKNRGGMSDKGSGHGGESSGVSKTNEVNFSPVKNGVKSNIKLKEKVNDGLNGKKGNVGMHQVVTSNSFAALSKDMDIDNGNVWENFKSKIDYACEHRIPISTEEKKSWSEDVVKYFKQKCIEVERSDKVSHFKTKIFNLERKISEANSNVVAAAQKRTNDLVESKMRTEGIDKEQAFGMMYDGIYKEEMASIHDMIWEKQMAEVELFHSLNLPFTDDVKNQWTEEMVAAYDGFVEDKRNDEINGHWEHEYNEVIEEVAEDSSAHASFIAKNNVNNDGGISRAQVQSDIASNPSLV